MTVKDIPLQWNALSPFVNIEAKEYNGKQPLILQVYNCKGDVILQKKISQLPFQLATHSLAIGSYRYTLQKEAFLLKEGHFSVP